MRVGLVGCGLIGRRRAEVLREFPEDKLVIVADVDESRARSLAGDMGCAATSDWRDVVAQDDVNGLIVSTTNDWLAPITISALRHGKHVLVEKPMGRNPTEADRVVAAATASRPLVLKTGFNHRHRPAIWKAHEVCTRGAIGGILFARCRYGHGGRPGYENEWRLDTEVAGGGELLDQGIHAIDLFRWFLGDFAEAVGFTAAYVWGGAGDRADAGGYQPNRPRSDVLQHPEDNAFALFRTATGQVASLHASWTQWKNLFCFEVFGREGYVVAEGLGGSYGGERLTVGRRRMEGGTPEEEVFEFPGADVSWTEEWREFAGAVREGREPLGSGHDGRQAVKMVYAVYESTQTGKVVRL